MANTIRSLRSSIANGTAIGDACVDLYAERVMIPRISLLSVLAGLSVLLVLLVRHRRRRRSRQSAKLTPGREVVVAKVATADHTARQRWFASFLATAAAWITIFLWSFSASTDSSGGARSAAQERPRIVFSFTTTPQGIDHIQPTLDALVHQEGDGFDLVYAIIPRMYRDKRVDIPSWLLDSAPERKEFWGITYGVGSSPFHDKLRVVVLDTDFGPASKVLGTLLVEQHPDTIIVYGDDDRVYPPQLCERALHYTHKFPHDAIAVLGGWISAEDGLYCGRSLAVGVNSVSFVGGAGGVAVKRRFFGLGEATVPAFQVANLSKACFLGDDYYLSHVLSQNGVKRRLVSDSCWNIEALTESFSHGGLSYAPSKHPGGANVEHYQQCIRELGTTQDLSHDGEFGSTYMYMFSRAWGVMRGLRNLYLDGEFVAC